MRAIFSALAILLSSLALGQTCAHARDVLPADRIYYFASTGSDANDCLSEAKACETPKGALDKIAELDLNGYMAVVQATGPSAVFTGPNGTTPIDIHRFPIGGGTILIQGNNKSPQTYTLRATAAGDAVFRTRNVNGAPHVAISGFRVESSSGHGLQFGHVGFGSWAFIVFGDCPSGRHVLTDQPLIFVTGSGPYWIDGNAESHIYADLGIIYVGVNATATFLRNVNIGSFIRVGFRGYFIGKHATYNMNGATNTGHRYRVSMGAVLDAEDLPKDHFPGSLRGFVEYGGRYLNHPSD